MGTEIISSHFESLALSNSNGLIHFCYDDNSLETGMLIEIGMAMLMYLVLGIDLLCCCCRASSQPCYCEYIQTFLRAYKTYCCTCNIHD